MKTLFTKGESNTKTAKSAGKGFDTLILHLAPAKESGFEVCSSRSPGCTMGCLFTAGRGRMSPVRMARINRTLLWFENRDLFKDMIVTELSSFVKRCLKRGTSPAVRMNGTSDILWENQFSEIFTEFASVQYYDYTKHVKRCLGGYLLPKNYHLTFSRSENNDTSVMEVLKAGRVNVAAVFDSKNFPTSWEGFPTYSADDDDLRFLDPPGGHVGCLYAKGKAKADKTGFVLPVLA